MSGRNVIAGRASQATIAAADDRRPSAERLNRECFCVTLDRDALRAAMNREAGDPGFCARFVDTRPHLFSHAPVFLPQAVVDAMLRVVRAVEATARLTGYRDAVLSRTPETARRSFGPLGAFMGYDFHLTGAVPKLIEVNTNAGGAFLNGFLAKAQRACCAEIEPALGKAATTDFDDAVLRMFMREWTLQRGAGTPQRVAIVDDRPEEQYLYPEFVLARRFFQGHGIDAVIADAAQLRYEGGRLTAGGESVDLVYNRVVDFALERPEHRALRDAYLDQAAVVTPGPFHHALLADKRNLALLGDPATLRSWGLTADSLADLAGIPRTELVTPDNTDRLWAARRTLFFKPACGYGSKAVYRGDKLTRGAWAEVARGGYVAQELAAPGERVVEIDGARAVRKTDVRLYVYDGRILLIAARLYQGQTTNFRTPGGGFAPVFAI
jgi:hypothetical protein